VKEPLDSGACRKLIQEILASGEVSFSGHALDEMAKDNLTTFDCVNVLRGGVVEPGEFEKGSWRFRVRTSRMTIVVAFRSERRLVVVTAWREKK